MIALIDLFTVSIHKRIIGIYKGKGNVAMLIQKMKNLFLSIYLFGQFREEVLFVLFTEATVRLVEKV